MNKKEQTKTEDPLGVKSFQLALKIVSLHKKLQDQKKELQMSRQIFKSGTAPGSMIREARTAKSDSDFIYKLSLAQEGCQETIYWLELLYKCKYIEQVTFDEINSLTVEVLKMLTSSIRTKKRNIKY